MRPEETAEERCRAARESGYGPAVGGELEAEVLQEGTHLEAVAEDGEPCGWFFEGGIPRSGRKRLDGKREEPTVQAGKETRRGQVAGPEFAGLGGTRTDAANSVVRAGRRDVWVVAWLAGRPAQLVAAPRLSRPAQKRAGEEKANQKRGDDRSHRYGLRTKT